MELVICAICGQPMIEDGFQEFRRRTDWYKCTSCTHEQVYPVPDMTGYYENGKYRQESRPDDDFSKPTVHNINEEELRGKGWFDYIKSPVERYVDVGSSSGSSLRVIQEEFNIPFVVGIEPSPWGNAYGALLRIEDLSLTHWRGDYDLVTCFHVLEHVEDPISFLLEIKRIASGQVCIETPRYPGNRLWPHLHQFTLNSLLFAMGRAGMGAAVCDTTYHIKVKHTVCPQ